MLVATFAGIAQGYPSDFVRTYSNGVCTAQPTRGYSRHGAPFNQAKECPPTHGASLFLQSALITALLLLQGYLLEGHIFRRGPK